MKIPFEFTTDVTGDYWEAALTNENESMQQCAERIVKHFNDTLRPGELPRMVTGIRYAGDKKIKVSHSWGKTNLYSLQNKNGYYDTYRCVVCLITGKRWGLGGLITPDAKYKNKQLCSIIPTKNN